MWFNVILRHSRRILGLFITLRVTQFIEPKVNTASLREEKNWQYYSPTVILNEVKNLRYFACAQYDTVMQGEVENNIITIGTIK